jgi:hypothetical protein
MRFTTFSLVCLRLILGLHAVETVAYHLSSTTSTPLHYLTLTEAAETNIDTDEESCVDDNHHVETITVNSESCLLSVRGGALGQDILNAALKPEEEVIIGKFLDDKHSDNKDDEDEFHIQGWRWHTLSMTRDSARLEKLTLQLLNSPNSEEEDTIDKKKHPLSKAVTHVVDFNLKGLHRVENDLFFPWLREKLTIVGGNGNDDGNVKKAFLSVINGIDEDRKRVTKLAEQMKKDSDLAIAPNAKPHQRQAALSNVLQSSSQIGSIMKSIYDREDRLLVPAVAKLVPSKEQKSFNNKVLRALGLFESRVHLVGMYDAVHDDCFGNKKERDLFEIAIPSIPRMMIPRWRRTLYEPQAGVLSDAEN